MDKRLILSVLSLVLSWECMPTCAQTNSTVTSDRNTTTEAPRTNITTATSAHATSKVAPDVSVPTATSANNATAAASGLIPSILESISRDNCSSSKLCLDNPSKCEPHSDVCYFLSVKQQSNQTYSFELSGQTEGYIAAGFSTDLKLKNIEIAYICANHNSTLRFFTGSFIDLVPNVTNKLEVTGKRGSVNANKIQCTFTAQLNDTEKRAASYAMGIFTGPYNSSSGNLGRSQSKTQTSVVVDMSDPTASLTDNSASIVDAVTHSFLAVLLATLCVLTFTAG